MVNLEVLNPVANISKGEKEYELARRFSDLNSKTIGLFWNGKPSGDAVNQVTSELLTNRAKDIRFKEYFGSVGTLVKPSYIRRASVEAIDVMVKECDAVIGSLGD